MRRKSYSLACQTARRFRYSWAYNLTRHLRIWPLSQARLILPSSVRREDLLQQDKPIYLVHGDNDWMFPVEIGQMAAELLGARNPNLIYNEIKGLGHTFARSELKQLLPWFSAALSLEQ